MAFWQENYQFIKEIYEMRHSKMAEWMENVEKVRTDKSEKIVFHILFIRPLLALWLTRSTLLLSSRERGTTSRLTNFFDLF